MTQTPVAHRGFEAWTQPGRLLGSRGLVESTRCLDLWAPLGSDPQLRLHRGERTEHRTQQQRWNVGEEGGDLGVGWEKWLRPENLRSWPVPRVSRACPGAEGRAHGEHPRAGPGRRKSQGDG